jgi:hypothetical protein
MIKTLALAAAIVTAGASGAMASTLNIALDGYCNTFVLNVTTPLIAGTRGGCGYTDIDGGTVAKVSGKPYTITNDTNDGSTLFTWYFAKAKKGHGSFFLYGSNGTSSTEVVSGTYTVTVTAISNRAGKDVTAR